MSEVLQLPRPWRLLRTSAWSLAEAAGLPLGAYLAGNALAGRDAGLLAGLAVAWLIVAARKVVTGQVPGLVMISALVLSVQTVLVFATGQTWIYLLQFPIAKLILALLFARSAPTEHPLISRLATEVVSLRHGAAGHPGLQRFFQRATWLWAAIFGLLAIVFAALVATQPIAFFLLASTAIMIFVILSGAGASTLWFFRVLRRHDLRLTFAGD
jgi:hypothetical protein